MGAPLRKTRLYVANDATPVLRPLPKTATVSAPRIVAFVRLPATPPRSRHLSWITAIAAVFLTALIFLLGAIAGTLFWFTYDARAPELSVAPKIVKVETVITPPEPQPEPAQIIVPADAPVAPLEEKKMPPVDIVLPASALQPPPSMQEYQVDTKGLQISMRDATQAEIDEVDSEEVAPTDGLNASILSLEQDLRKEPGNILTRFNLAILYDRANQTRKALLLYRQVLAVVSVEMGDNAEMGDTNPPLLSEETVAALRIRAGYLQKIENAGE